MSTKSLHYNLDYQHEGKDTAGVVTADMQGFVSLFPSEKNKCVHYKPDFIKLCAPGELFQCKKSMKL